MRRIINGECYDTETSTLIAEAKHGISSDADQYSEALYCNKNGVFFLASEGGVESFYASLFRDGKSAPGWDIIPVTASEARRWLEDQDYLEEIERLFGEQPEAGEGLAMLHVAIPQKLQNQLEDIAHMTGESQDALVIRGLETLFSRVRRERKR